MFNITKFCQNKNQDCKPINYSKIVTGGNDPSTSRAVRYSQLARNSTYKKTYVTLNPNSILMNPPSIFNTNYSPPAGN